MKTRGFDSSSGNLVPCRVISSIKRPASFIPPSGKSQQKGLKVTEPYFDVHFKEASVLVSKNARLDMKDVFTKYSLFVKYAIDGDTKRIKELLTVDFVKTARRDCQSSYFVSGLFALSGMKDEAFDWLENAVDRGFINYPFISEYDPFLKDIRSEPRFKKLLERVKHEWENFEV